MNLKDISVAELKSELESRKQEKRSIEFSKLMLLLILCSVFFVIAFSAYEMHRTGDLDSMPTLIASTLSFGGVSSAFYAWKARGENISKSNERIETLRIESDFREAV